MAIRYDKDYNREIARIVKNFNAKVMRLQGVERLLAPDTILVSTLKKTYTKRRELNRKLKELQLFSQKGMEEEVQIGEWNTNKYQLTISKRQAVVAKANLTREINKAKSSRRLASTPYIRNLEKRREILNRPIETLSEKMLGTRQRIIKGEFNARQKQEKLYNNLFQMIYKTAYTAGSDPKIIEGLLHQLRQMSPAQLADALNTLPAMSAFILKYSIMDDAGQSAPAQVDEAMENMLNALTGVNNFYQI